MTTRKTASLISGLCVAGFALAFAPDKADAQCYSYQYYSSAPVYVAPAPVYVAPAPVYTYTAPTYYYARPYRAGYVSYPNVGYYGHGSYKKHWGYRGGHHRSFHMSVGW